MLVRTRDCVARARNRLAAELHTSMEGLPDIRLFTKPSMTIRSAMVNNVGKVLSAADRYWTMEIQIVEQYEQMIDLLDNVPNQWRVTNGKLFIDDDNLLQRYNGFADKADEITRLQETIRLDASEKYQSLLDDLDRGISQ
jgi:hypothetical protein